MPTRPIRLGAVFRRRDVGDVGLRDGDVAAARAGERARDEQRHERGRGIFKTGADGEQHIGQRRAGGAERQNRPAAVPVGKPAPDGREDELHGRVGRDDGADEPAARAVVPAVNWHERHDDAKADEVNEDREQDDEDGRFAIHVQKSFGSLAVKSGESNLLATGAGWKSTHPGSQAGTAGP